MQGLLVRLCMKRSMRRIPLACMKAGVFMSNNLAAHLLI
jgi:hypothetical protein